MSDVLLRMDETNDAPVMYGMKLPMDLNLVQPDASRGYLMPQLIPH